MGWFAFRTAGVLVILMMVVEVNSEFWVEVKEQNEEDGTALQKPPRRYKREWVQFARPCREREDNSKKNPIATITSDFQNTQEIKYHISGMGIDQPPYGVFVINPKTGEINITTIVDREETPMFQIKCQALDTRGRDVETPLVLTVKILDVNDNPPVFSQNVFYGEIEENSAANTLVMVLNATDADEPNHLNSKIAFKIVSQEPEGQPMFLLNRHTGEVRSMTSTLDREKNSKYSLRVSGADLDGAGQATECGCEITIKDVNDNFPILKESQKLIQIEENTLSSEVIRFQVTDYDEEFTDNWYAEYFFVSGNEGNWFVIKTDTKTNEGILKVVKALDYEQFQTMELNVAVKNRAPFHQSVISQYKIRPIPIKVQVIDVKEGIAFHPTSKTFTVQKGISYKKLINYVLGPYLAIDEDTGKPASFVRYVMGRNDGSFLGIDSKTSQIKFVKNLNRDSAFIVNKTLTAEILAIDDNTGKTSTGTVTVRVPNFNENCPTVVADKKTVCRTSASVIVMAKPLPNQPDTGPFTFSLVEQPLGTPATWSITTINGTSANLRAQKALSSETYPLSLIVTDRQGMSCEIPETLELLACDCNENQMCYSRVPFPTVKPSDTNRQRGTPPVSLGPAGIGLLILGLLMLLLAPLLLLFCDCGTGGLGGVGSGFVPVPDGSEGTIHQWGIEGAQPQDKEITNICVPPITANGTEFMESSEVCTNAYAAETITEGTCGIELMTRLRAASGSGGTTCMGGTTGLGGAGYSGTMRTRHSTGGTIKERAEGPVNMSFLDTYFSQKAYASAEEEDSQGISDCLLVYDAEGVDPPSSPVGCCSFIADDFDDTFLDSLGPKFKTLADISMGIYNETKFSEESRKTNITTTETPGSRPSSATFANDTCPSTTNATWQSTTNVTCQPTTNVTCQPTTNVTCQPITNVTCQPTTNVTCQPTTMATCQPTTMATCQPPTTNLICQPPTTNLICQPPTNVVCQLPTNAACQPPTNVTCQLATGSNFYSNETSAFSASASVLQPAIPIPDPLLQGNYLVTESYTASGSFLKPSSIVFDSQITENMTVTERVTERVTCPISSVSSIQGNLHCPTQLSESCNMTYTEDLCPRLI